MLGIKLAERTKNSQFLPIRPPRPATPFGPDPRRSRTWARRAERSGRRFAFAPGIPQRGAQEALPRPQAQSMGDFAELHAWIAANLTSDLTIDRLAEHCGMAPRTFARAYVAKHGRTPGRMVEAMRIEAACRALEETQLPLKSVAANTGYGDEQNLRRVFQRQLSISPSQYRGRFSVHRNVVP
jgi:transcriptional regulator GlxA family with amidase domain